MTRYRIVKIGHYYDDEDFQYFYVIQKKGILFWKTLHVFDTEYLAKTKLGILKSVDGKLKEIIYED